MSTLLHVKSGMIEVESANDNIGMDAWLFNVLIVGNSYVTKALVKSTLHCKYQLSTIETSQEVMLRRFRKH